MTAPQLLGPMVWDHLIKTETHDEGLILLQVHEMNNHEVPSYRVPCEQYTKGITQWIDTLWEESGLLACNKPFGIHCKAGSVSVRLVFETRGKSQDFVARYKDDAIPYTINNPFCCTSTTITVRQSISIEDREIEKKFPPLWKELAEQLEILFLDGDDEGVVILPALDVRSQILSVEDRRNGIGKPGFKLAPLGSGQTFTLVASDLSVPGISHEVLQRVFSSQQASRVTAALPPPRFFALRVDALFVSCFDGF